MDLAEMAGLAHARGDGERARRLYSEAADLERAALERMSKDKVRSIGILAVSAATLLHRAERLGEAEDLALQYLGREILPAARAGLHEVLGAVPVSVAVSGGRDVAPRRAARITVGEQRQMAALITFATEHGHTALDFEHIYREYVRMVGTSPSESFACDAEAIVQDVFLSYIKKRDQIDNTRSWLAAAASNASRAYRRKEGVQEPLPEDFDILANALNPEEQMEADEQRSLVRTAFARLSPEEQSLLHLRFLKGQAFNEIARQLRISPPTASKRVKAALAHFRALLEKL
jgi:RNA polymerase sigma-70 factor (ECF subfamily)